MFARNAVEGDWGKKGRSWKTVMAFPEPLPLNLSDAAYAAFYAIFQEVKTIRQRLTTIPRQKFSGHRSRIAWFAESFF
jgi:hypothetical protein